MDKIIFLYATMPDEATAHRISTRLVDAGAAACVNIIPGMKSVYRRDGNTWLHGSKPILATQRMRRSP